MGILRSCEPGASGSDLPGVEFITGNIRASACDAEALTAVNQTIERQARQW